MKAAPVKSCVRKGSLRIDVRAYSDGRFGFDYAPPGEDRIKVRLCAASDAEARAREIIGMARGGKVERLAIDEDEYAEFLRWKATRKRPCPVPELVASFLKKKAEKGVTRHTLRDLRSALVPFAKSFAVKITDLTRDGVEKWLNSREVGPRRWNNMRAAIVALHRHARDYDMLPAERTSVEKIEKRKVKVSVLTYSPAQLCKLLAAVPADWQPLILLGAFAGLRPEEISPDTRYKSSTKPGIKWENILWEKNKIDVPAEVAKDRRRRFATLSETLREWLYPLSGGGKKTGLIAPRGYYPTLIAGWSAKSGVQWLSDALRHSYASYRLALTRDMASLCLEMGNSATMIHRHYLDLKHEDEAREWFAVLPKSAKSAKKTASEKPVARIKKTIRCA